MRARCGGERRESDPWVTSDPHALQEASGSVSATADITEGAVRARGEPPDPVEARSFW
jgi:hypothetical protein